MKTPRRPSLITSVRLALASGGAAVGWMVLGATGAHAVEAPSTLSVEDTAAVVTRKVPEPAPVGGVPQPVQAASTAAAPAEALLAGPGAAAAAPVEHVARATAPVVEVTLEPHPVPVVEVTLDPAAAPVEQVVVSAPVVEALPVEPVTGLAENPVAAVQKPADTVQHAIDTVQHPVDTVQHPVDTVQHPVDTVRAVAEPVTAVVWEALPVPAPVVEAPPAIVEGVVDAAPVVDEALPSAPVTRTVEGVPALVGPALPGETAAPVAVENLPAAVTAETAVARPQTQGADTVSVGDPVVAQPPASSDAATFARGAGASSADFLAGLAHSRDGTGTPVTLTAVPAPPDVQAFSAAGGAAVPGPGSTTWAGSAGGSGPPLRGAGPDARPGDPADLSYLTLFPQLAAAQDEAFFGGVGRPPAAPVFEPGSTPD
ncbi:hypothetical protein ACH9EU_17230 [Kocuria sp. M1R5S2]|uniref:hypothetical protein n=1 Tax=Kocuria rhizosphaerae TaxID=3376285 RepID=UPI0037AD5E2E